MVAKLYIEEPYSRPTFGEIGYASYKANPRQKIPRARRYAGVRVECQEEGDLSALVTTDGDVFLRLTDLVTEKYHRTTLFLYDGADLDILVGSLEERDARTLYEGKVVSVDGVRLRYTPLRSLTLWNIDYTVRVCSLKLWYRQYDLHVARKMAGLSSNNLPEERATLELAELLESSGRMIWGERPAMLFGASLATRDMFLSSVRGIDLEWIPKGANEYAYNCLHAPWIDIFMKGVLPIAYDYDINSAYPFEMAQLLKMDYLGGRWFQSEKYEPAASYGFCQALITIHKEVLVSPIRLRYERKLFSPHGTWIGYITKDEIDFIDRYEMGKVQVLSGWWFVAKSQMRPFKEASHLFLAARSLAKVQERKVLSYILKMASATVYGRFLQKFQALDGEWLAASTFSPVYACTVMTRVKLRLAALATMYPKHVAAVTVDGILTTRKLPYTPHGGTGGVKLSGVGPGIVAAPLIYDLPGRESAFDLREILERDPIARSLQFKDHVRTSLCVALGRNRYDLAGLKAEVGAKIIISNDFGRRWIKSPVKARDLLQHTFRSRSPSVEDICWRRLLNFEAGWNS